MQINLGGIVHLSTVDWTGSATTVIFLRGCPLRCPHCQNHELQGGENLVELNRIMSQIASGVKGEMKNTSAFFGDSGQIDLDESYERAHAKPFVNALLLSGGEPMMQPEQAAAIFRMARNLGLKTGLETSGYYPERLLKILQENLVDKVFLDIKAALYESEYEKATGVIRGVASLVRESLKTCMSCGVMLEIRTTVFPDMPSTSEVVEIARVLNTLKSEYPEHRLERLVLQQGLPRKKEFDPVSWDKLKLMAESIGDLIDVQLIADPKVKTDNLVTISADDGRAED